MIERAQRAVVLGPFPDGVMANLVVQAGDMAKAQVLAVKKFFCEKLLMSQEDIRSLGLYQVCSTGNDNLLVKFRSTPQARILNQFKKNLPRDAHVDDYVPPCLSVWEQVLEDHGT